MKNKFIISIILTLSFVAPTQAAEHDERDVVHDVRGNVIRGTLFGNCVRTDWASGNGDECGQQQVAKVSKHRQIAEEERTVYFEFNKTQIITSESAKLDSLSDTLKSMNDITGVSIVGYADRIGTSKYNEKLSKQRAKIVEKYLQKRGYLNTTIAKTSWLGETAPITECPNNTNRKELITCLGKDRRVTIEIQYKE